MAPLKSFVWKYFEKSNKLTARCRLCNRQITNHGNTTNLKSHLLRLHSSAECPIIDGSTNRADTNCNESQEAIDTAANSNNSFNKTDPTEPKWETYDTERIEPDTNCSNSQYLQPREANTQEHDAYGDYHPSSTPDDRNVGSKRRRSHDNDFDDSGIFGAFVANELRNLSSPALRRKMKRSILQLILEIGSEEDEAELLRLNN